MTWFATFGGALAAATIFGGGRMNGNRKIGFGFSATIVVASATIEQNKHHGAERAKHEFFEHNFIGCARCRAVLVSIKSHWRKHGWQMTVLS